MSTYHKTEFTAGKWADKPELYQKQVTGGKLVSEPKQEPGSKYMNEDGTPKMRWIAKIQFAGYDEALKVELNRASMDALHDAYGAEMAQWAGHVVGIAIFKDLGKKFPLYVVPAGFEVVEDENGYRIVVPKAGAKQESFKDDMSDLNASLNAEGQKNIGQPTNF